MRAAYEDCSPLRYQFRYSESSIPGSRPRSISEESPMKRPRTKSSSHVSDPVKREAMRAVMMERSNSKVGIMTRRQKSEDRSHSEHHNSLHSSMISMMDDVVRRVSRQPSSSDDIVDEEIPPRPPETLQKQISQETPVASIRNRQFSKPNFSNIAKSVGRAKLAVNNMNKKTRAPSPKPTSKYDFNIADLQLPPTPTFEDDHLQNGPNVCLTPSWPQAERKSQDKTTTQMESILRFFTDSEKDQQKNYGLGTIKFSLAYDFSSSTFIVKIMKADKIPAMDISGTSDPFVKVCLLPDKKNKLETKVRRKTLNPQWNESLVFQNYPYEKISQRVLYIQMMDWDRFSRNDPIGEVFVQLNRVHLSSDPQTFTEALAPCTATQKRGQLLISLMYVPLEGRLVLGIIKGSNLRAMDLNGSSDPYTKIWLHHRGQRTEKKKTAVKKNTLNPEFNEQFEFYIPMEKLKDYTLEVIVMDKDRIGRNECIGKVILGHKGSSLERQHWRDMISSPRLPSSQWHVLKLSKSN